MRDNGCPRWDPPPTASPVGPAGPSSVPPHPSHPSQQTPETDNEIKFQAERGTCPQRYWRRRCRCATRWVPAALRSPGQSRRKHKQPWEGARFPAEQGDRLQLGEQEGAGLAAAAPLLPQSLRGMETGHQQAAERSRGLLKEQTQLVEMLGCKYSRCKALLLIKKVFP